MLPFFLSPAVKIHAQAPNDPSLQQAALFNQMQFPVPSVVNSSNRNTNSNGFIATNVAAAAAAVAPLMDPSSFLNCPNILPVVQNNCLSAIAQQHVQFGATQHLNQQLLALQLLGISCGMPHDAQQFQGQLQNLNMFTPLPPGVGPFSVNNRPQNFNFIGGLPNGQICFPTMMMDRNQTADLISTASSGLGSNKPEHLGNHPMVAVGNSHTSLCNGALYTGGKKISFTHEGKHESLVNPKKKPQFQDSKSIESNKRMFNGTSGRVQKKWKGEPQFAKCNKPILTERPRCLPVTYTEHEIQQWIEARRKNFPTTANIKKKLVQSDVNNEDADDDAQLRRQQLKQVLAKQEELGVEVAEIPQGYLSELDNQFGGQENNSKVLNMTNNFPNKHICKRGRHQEKWQAKRLKLTNESAAAASILRREPTLLRKLLSSDIRRDNSRLLQAFRFMILNSFFEHWPAKLLDFPSFTVRDIQCENETAVEKTSSLNCINNVEFEVGQCSVVKEIEGPKQSCVRDDADFSSKNGQ
ncbi:Nuclear fragile X mental retardation-interacting protein 1 (NUFIP1) [Musa troglodytarum]|uniref:Nuclear fragile X mental retardation-interacting protein 1 (NUFIP1) n=1 Tax=Musa troglodytarum TaxID=320322 RepID=A0A9E7FZK1_9LILI|nr:Nuclear fragile X mental retardation-interacting protein 1 (NUFIP1) [Musa troglodytarum]